MSTIVQCQKCGQQVSIPGGMAFDAIVRCPLCKAEYPLRVLLMAAMAPPSVEPVAPAPAPTNLVDTRTIAAPVAVPAAAPAAMEPVDAAPASPAPAEAATEIVAAEAVPVPAPAAPVEDEIGFAEPPREAVAAAAVTEQVVSEPVAAEAVVQAVAAEPAAAVGASQETADESPIYGLQGESNWSGGRSSDAASMGGALADIWKAAGVAPPLESAETQESVEAAARAEADHAPLPAAYEFTGVKTDAAGVTLGPSTSYAARARQEEKGSPKKLVRVVGMVISGMLGVVVMYFIFTFAIKPFMGNKRSTPAPAPKAAPAKAAPAPKGPTPDEREKKRWDGIKPIG